MFTITHPDGQTESTDFDITINPHGSNYFRYLINSSRIYWRKELEQNLADMTREQADEYRAAHRFDIQGDGLTPDEIQEQKQCLINKIFTIGYMMHRFKSPSRPWAPFVMDNVIGEKTNVTAAPANPSCLRRFLNSSTLCRYQAEIQNFLRTNSGPSV